MIAPVVSLPVCGAFVGRAAEVAALQDAYRDPAVHTVLVAGEAGIGKSRLVVEFTTRVGAHAAVLCGRCPEFGAKGVPFAPFVAVMRALLRDQGVDGLAALLPVDKPALGRWLPELAARSGSAEADTDRIRLFGEILTVLEQLATTRPVVVVLEDLHWADDASLELLAFLVANLTQRDLLLVGTYRPADSEPLRRLVAGWRRAPGVRLLTPAPLTRHEVGRQLAALLGREPEPGTIARVFERSKGIPLFVEALGPAPEDTPADLSELLLGYLSDLPDRTGSVLRLAAVAGSPVRHAPLEAAADLPRTSSPRPCISWSISNCWSPRTPATSSGTSSSATRSTTTCCQRNENACTPSFPRYSPPTGTGAPPASWPITRTRLANCRWHWKPHGMPRRTRKVLAHTVVRCVTWIGCSNYGTGHRNPRTG